MSLNRGIYPAGLWTATCELDDRRMVLGKPAEESESLVFEIERQLAGSKVQRDTRNLVGIRGDHPPRLNTT